MYKIKIRIYVCIWFVCLLDLYTFTRNKVFFRFNILLFPLQKSFLNPHSTVGYEYNDKNLMLWCKKIKQKTFV